MSEEITVQTSDNQRAAEKLWCALSIATFGRARHAKLWAAMADLPDEEKHRIDDEAERIIVEHLEAQK